MFIAQALGADRSCQKAVDDAAIKRLIGGLPTCSTYTGAYCKARQRLPLEMVSTLTRYTGALMAEHAPIEWHWRGRPVRLVPLRLSIATISGFLTGQLLGARPQD